MRVYLLRRATALLILLTVVISCENETQIERHPSQSPYADVIRSYVDQLAPNTAVDGQIISDLKISLDYTSIQQYHLTSNEELLIAEAPGIKLEEELKTKALLFIQHGEIVRANLVSFTNRQVDQNHIILSIAKAQFEPENYSGKISYYTIYGDLLFSNLIENGELVSNTILQAKRNSGKNNGRTQACIDWYLITTYHYANGNTTSSEQYIKTTCDGDCQTSRTAGIQCDGGTGTGGGSYNITLPATARDGDTYTVTEPNGKTTTWMFVAASNSWTITLIVLPEVVVQSDYATYSYLSSDGPALDGSLVVGPDGFLYVYDAWSATWQGALPYEVGGPARRITDRPAHLRCFNRSQGATLTIFADQPVAGHDDPISGVSDVGHAWISISQGGITRTFGYYPTGIVHPYSPTDVATLGIDAGHSFDVSVQIQITASELSQILNYAINMPATYNLDINNCVNFVVESCGAAGIALPENTGTWLGGGGLNPGRFGQDLRNLNLPNKTETHDNDGGTAPQDSGSCQ
ncbi:MAG TPA: hypothetical protein VIN08_01275 [Ohtaekwangia sp.]|uniref:hypothetical protein n=1 Tax=Ohtaekwangia sp. TaxID=2066019 RepID=UPI002F936DD0